MLNDLKFALRQLRKSPGFALTAIVTLALGIGANAVVFSVLNALILKPVNVPQGQNLYMVQRGQWPSHSYLDYLDLRDRNRGFQSLLTGQIVGAVGVDTGGNASTAWPELASGNYFDGLEMRRFGLRDLLLVVQIAICAVLVTSSLVAARGLARSLHSNFGFKPENTMLVSTDLQMSGYEKDSRAEMQRRMPARGAAHNVGPGAAPAGDWLGCRPGAGTAGYARAVFHRLPGHAQGSVGITLTMLLLGLLAALIPARRALIVDPIILLREE